MRLHIAFASFGNIPAPTPTGDYAPSLFSQWRVAEANTETLYLLGEQDRIVGTCGFTVRSPRAQQIRQKPRLYYEEWYDPCIRE